ncbi:MAG: enoyl-CoA hydratase/isomerase family protein [Frankiaceae bacterium]|nr:enoyl-CoA hydratase/isomerase family protein [Frankiaceae bacterium]
MPALNRDGDVCILNIGDDENRFTLEWTAAMRACLAEVAAMPAPVALVTVADGKFWSNGLDLDWLTANLDQAGDYISEVQGLLADALILPVPTVAAIQGHAFAAGAMLTLSHDFRTMRSDRGYWCLPEVDINIPFSVGMDALIRSKLTPAVAIEAMTTGLRYGGDAAAASGIVTRSVPGDAVVAAAVEIAGPLAAKAGPTLGTIKARMFAQVTDLLAQPTAL